MREETIKFPKIDKVTRQDKVTPIYGIKIGFIMIPLGLDNFPTNNITYPTIRDLN